MNVITASIEKVAYELGPVWTSFHFPHSLTTKLPVNSVGDGNHIIKVTEFDGVYTVTRYTLNRVEVASVRVSSGAATVDTIAGIILLLAN